MDQTKDIRIPLEIPTEERAYIYYVMWILSKHIIDVRDDFIVEVVTQIPDLQKHFETVEKLYADTPPDQPYMLHPEELLSFFIICDIGLKSINGPDYFTIAMKDLEGQAYSGLQFDDAHHNKEKTNELLQPFLNATIEWVEKSPRATRFHQYLRISRRLPMPGSKGVRQEFAPLDGPLAIPLEHPIFQLSKYHHEETLVTIPRNIMVDFLYLFVFNTLKVLTDAQDNVPSRIIHAYFPDFRYYFDHTRKAIVPQKVTDEEFADALNHIKQNGFKMQLPLVLFANLFIAFDFSIKLTFSSRNYINVPALLIDRFGSEGEKIFGQRPRKSLESDFKLLHLPLTDIHTYMTNHPDIKGSTFMEDYKTFSMSVPWWD